MNSGLPIVSRQNHSLVVSYYNDPSNGNPGTDATIYEPSPDFQFLNDTGHYILFQAENLTDTQELRFTFWGTSDGRQGSYSPPIVSRWIPVGDTQYVETLDLEPGVLQCQASHIGADASFVYTVITRETETIQTLFESHYRPLPKICLVGVEEITTEVEEESPP
jgi:vancomycin resistance protein YoaR